MKSRWDYQIDCIYHLNFNILVFSQSLPKKYWQRSNADAKKQKPYFLILTQQLAAFYNLQITDGVQEKRTIVGPDGCIIA